MFFFKDTEINIIAQCQIYTVWIHEELLCIIHVVLLCIVNKDLFCTEP